MVITDGSESYRSAIRQHLGHATHVVDWFHVAQWFAAALIETRRRIQRIGPKGSRPAYDPESFRSRYRQLTRADRLTPEARQRLERILTRESELAHAWDLYQTLHRIYLAADNEQANQALGEFIDCHYTTSLPEFEDLIGTLLDWATRSSPSTTSTAPPTDSSKAPTRKLRYSNSPLDADSALRLVRTYPPCGIELLACR